MTLSLVGDSELRLNHKLWARVVSVRDTGTVSILRQEGDRNCGTSTARRAPFRIWSDRAQATAHRRMTGEGRSVVTGICQELPMMLLGVQSSLRGKVTPEVFLEACRFS